MRFGWRRGTVLAILCACAVMALYVSRASAQEPHATAKRAAAASTPAVVKMVGDQLTFDPPRIVIRRGQSVEWQNQSNQLHNVVDDATKATNKADVGLPGGAKPFASEFLKPGDKFTQRFTVRGVYRYVCTLHEVQGMKGEIVVK